MRGLPHPRLGAAPPEYAIDAQKVNIIKIDLSTARDRQRVNIGGSLLWVIDASSDIATLDFFFREDQTEGIPLRLGSKLSGIHFSRTEVTNTAQQGGWVKILYAADKGAFLGVENPYLKASAALPAAIAENSFFGGATISPVNRPTLQLFNPAGSGKTLLLQSFQLVGNLSGAWDVYRATNALATLGTTPGNRYLGSTVASVAEVRTEDRAGPPASSTGMGVAYPSVGQRPQQYEDKWVIPPGIGLTFQWPAAGVSGWFNAEWQEV